MRHRRKKYTLRCEICNQMGSVRKGLLNKILKLKLAEVNALLDVEDHDGRRLCRRCRASVTRLAIRQHLRADKGLEVSQ